jgi:hypothetical protein
LIFVDANIPMYLVGAPHPHKADAQRLIERCVADHERLVTDVEVFQEIIHRYVAIQRREWIQPAFDAVLGITDEVFSVELPDVQRAKEVALGIGRPSSRDALHMAVMERRGVRRVLTFDEDYDRFPQFQRVR